MGIFFDGTTEIDAPIGQAAKDYTSWLQENPTIADEIDGMIKVNALSNYGDY
jgi:hypothetical protein